MFVGVVSFLRDYGRSVSPPGIFHYIEIKPLHDVLIYYTLCAYACMIFANYMSLKLGKKTNHKIKTMELYSLNG